MATASLPGFEDMARASLPLRIAAAVSAGVAIVGLAALARADVNPNPLFHPHGYCYLWEPSLVGVHVAADSLIALSYLAISTTLVYLVWRSQKAIPFGWMFLTFGAFIVACGATHAMEVVTLWHPLFWTSADVKIVTAVASIAAAVALPPLVPRVLTVLDSAKLSETRRIALEESNVELERRVADRTAELEHALVREQDLRGRAESANRVKDDFLGLMSHELRTPLNAVLGWSSMLVSGSASPESAQKAAAAIERNARVQAQLVDDLLDVSRIVAGKLKMASDPVRLATVVRAAVETVTPAAEAKRIRLVVSNEAPAAMTIGDARRLQQIVWNLLSNAVKFTPVQGRVEVAIRDAGPHVVIQVSDTGEGIDPKFIPRLFERFVQADTSSKRAHGGLGLGLALVRHLTELHGGTVGAASEGPGRGASFTITLPVVVAGGIADATRHNLADRLETLEGVTVLVVDDDVETLELLVTGLSRHGVTVRTAISAAEARAQLLESGGVDIIVCDLAMPEEDGLTFVRDLRTRRIEIPIVAFTANGQQSSASIIHAGFSVRVAKPATADDVARALAAVLQQRL